MAYNPSSEDSIIGSPVYFFYDCETTGCEACEDRIIEIAAVLDTHHLPQPHTSTVYHLGSDDNHFTSLCYCTKEINPDSAKVVRLTLEDLKSKPKLPAVLDEFFKWISRKVSEVERQSHLKCTPVLVAHSGNLLDFPVLLKELERINCGPLDRSSCQLVRTFRTLNINFVDTYVIVKLSADSDPIFKGLKKLSVEAIYKHFFPHESYEGHRALEDAKALGKIFTKSPVSEKLCGSQVMVRSTDTEYMKLKKFEMWRSVGIPKKKAEDLARKKIYLQEMEEEYKRAPGTFTDYLRRRVDMEFPSDKMMKYFSSLKVTD